MNLRPYAQLVRLPNLPTAFADIALAGLAAGALVQRWPVFIVLMLASACLYMSGMVWNDFFDVAQDARERPDRPIPSGRVSRRSAGMLGTALMAAGLLLALLAGSALEEGRLRPVVVAGLLTSAILLYDSWLKHTWLGPVAMGSCRFLNVLLGVTLTGSFAWPLGPHLALVVGLYIVGVTWFARTEARTSSQAALAGAAAVMLAALVLAVPLPVLRPSELESPATSPLFPYLLVAFGFIVGLPVSRAITAPTPANVQAGVKRALIGLILLDTVLATATAGNVGLVLLVLLVPSLYLNRKRWLYAT
jgi:4-hydroxybenzoate polyprenyltransferase